MEQLTAVTNGVLAALSSQPGRQKPTSGAPEDPGRTPVPPVNIASSQQQLRKIALAKSLTALSRMPLRTLAKLRRLVISGI